MPTSHTARLVASTYTRSSSTYVTVTNPDYLYTNTSNSTNYCTIRGRNNTSNTYYLYITGFNFSEIPSNATVTSFSIKLRAYRNSYESATYTPRLCSARSNSSISGTSFSQLETTDTTLTASTGSLTWSTLSSYGTNFSIQIRLRGTSSSNYPYVYVYGAEIEVNYTLPIEYYIDIIRHDLFGMIITAGDGSGNTYTVDDSNTSVSYPILEGKSFDMYINNANADEFVLACNSEIVTPVNQGGNIWMYSISNIGDDYAFDVFIPLYVRIESSIVSILYNYCNACTTSTSGVYATWAGSNVITQWTGDITNYTIKDNGTDVKSSGNTSYTTTGGRYTITNIQEDHYVEILQARNDIYIKVNGTWKKADTIYAKVGGTWKAVDAVYKKENGSWAAQNDFSALFDPNGLFVYSS